MRTFLVMHIVTGEIVDIVGFSLLDALARADLDPEYWMLVE